jgi:hypothetical protein
MRTRMCGGVAGEAGEAGRDPSSQADCQLLTSQI